MQLIITLCSVVFIFQAIFLNRERLQNISHKIKNTIANTVSLKNAVLFSLITLAIIVIAGLVLWIVLKNIFVVLIGELIFALTALFLIAALAIAYFY